MKSPFIILNSRLLNLILILSISISSYSNTITLKPGPSTGNDAYLDQNTPNTNYGNHLELSATSWDCSFQCNVRGLLQFDLSSLPVGSIITNARLSLFAASTPLVSLPGFQPMNGNNQSILQRVTSSWNENTVTWNTTPTATTQNQVILSQSNSPVQDYLNIDVKNIVQDMINNPASSFGFLLRLSTELPLNSMIFASSDNSFSALRPEITIEYIEYTGDQCKEFRLDDPNGADVLLASFTPLTNYGNHEEISGSAWICGGNSCFGRGLFSFDLSSIPSSTQITAAYLDLYANPSPSNGNGIAMQGNNSSLLQRVVSNWTENGTSWNTSPNTTIQNQVILEQSTSSFQNYTNIDVKNLVQDMITNSTSSYGFMIKLVNETAFSTMIFASSDYPDSLVHPKLSICYASLIGISEMYNVFNGINIFPNPVSDIILLNVNLKISAKLKLEIVDVLGRIVYSEAKGKFVSGNHNIQINTEGYNIKRGIYFLKLYANDQFVEKKIIKN